MKVLGAPGSATLVQVLPAALERKSPSRQAAMTFVPTLLTVIE
jgi:hypothetical protein